MTQAKDGSKVKVNYTGKLDDGTIFDTSEGKAPLEFTLGSKQVIPGFEAGVTGMKVGEKKTINIPADQAYGPHQKEMVIKAERKQLPPDLKPEVGQQLQMNHQNGQTFVVKVTAIDDTAITLDGNHPLAGKNLTFDIELLEIN